MCNSILLGNSRNPSNDIKVNDPKVSRMHLKITYLNEDKLLVEDLGSMNGTFINNKDRPVRSKEIGIQDTILVGDSRFTALEIRDVIRERILANKTNYINEFQTIENEFANRKKELKNLSSQFHTRTNVTRVIVVVLFMMFYFLFLKDLLEEALKEIAFLVLIIGSGAAALLVEKLFSKDELVEKRNIIIENYETKLRCPKCNHYLGAKSIRYWKRLGRCTVCDARWVND